MDTVESGQGISQRKATLNGIQSEAKNLHVGKSEMLHFVQHDK